MPDTPSGKRKLILFVDDDASLLRLGCLTLERAGYRYLGALGGHEGLLKARESRPDLILLDYMMPDICGKEVFDALRQAGAVCAHACRHSDCAHKTRTEKQSCWIWTTAICTSLRTAALT